MEAVSVALAGAEAVSGEPVGIRGPNVDLNSIWDLGVGLGKDQSGYIHHFLLSHIIKSVTHLIFSVILINIDDGILSALFASLKRLLFFIIFFLT